jgi:hypothetical protein
VVQAMTWAPNSGTVKAYTEGDCWLLALELRRLTGFPMVFSVWTEDHSEIDEWDWDHVAVRLPDGRVMDVTGVKDEDVFRLEWRSKTLYDTDSSDVIRMLLGPLVDDNLEGDGEFRTRAQARACARRMLNEFRIPFEGRRHRDARGVQTTTTGVQ